MMKKGLGTKKERFEVLLEEIRSQNDLVLEHVADIAKRQPKIDAMAEDIEKIKIRLDALQVGYTIMNERLGSVEGRLGYVETEMKEIRKLLENVPSRTEFNIIDKRVSRLEARASL